MPLKEDRIVRHTGGQVDELVMALIEAAYDKDTTVREILGTSLFELGKRQPHLVLSSCNSFLMKHAKLPQGHRVVLLSSMEKIITQTIGNIDRDFAIEIIKQASAELTQSKDVIPDWQSAASSVLVAIGMQHCNDVMSEMLDKFQPGVLPHYFVVQTLASLATANVFGMVPFIKACLGTMLPMLGMAKHDNMRWVFAKALASFCEAIIEYIANIEKAPDPNVTTDFFVTEMYAAWDLLFNVWLNSKESKLRSAIIDALGQMSYILMPSKLQDCLPRLLPAILSLYKKHQEPHLITQGLYMMLDAAIQSDPTVLESYLDSLLASLFPQICTVVDYSNHLSVKNHNEILRCFTVITKAFSSRLISFLLLKLDTGNERVRIGVLTVIRHLVNAAGASLDKKEDLILSGLKLVLNDQSNKVKKVLAQTIIAMSHHGYLELEGGQQMIEFIVRQCSLLPEGGKRPTDPEYVSNESLRSMCDSVLNLLSTTVENIDRVLWPFLLELLVPEPNTESMSSLCLAVSSIATRKRQENDDDFLVDFNQQVNVPKPTEIFMRLMVLSGFPTNGRSRGVNVLKAIHSLGPVIHEKLPELWDNVLPKLTSRLEEMSSSGEFSQKTWEELVLKLLAKSLDQVDDETWTTKCGDDLCRHIPLYTGMTEEKYFLFKCIGVVMRKSAKKESVNRYIDVVFANVKHSSPLEREGCAMAMGYGAASHLDVVLGKVDALGKLDAKRTSGFLNFFKDASGDGDEKVKATLMLCVGYITFNAPPELIESRLEASILAMVNHQLSHVKDQTVKQSLIRSVDQIGRSMHPDHLRKNTAFTHRNNLLQHMKNYVKNESITSLTSETRSLAIGTCATLIKLDPKLASSELQDLVKTLSASVIALPADPVSQSYEEHSEYEQLMEKSMSSLSEFFREVLIKDMTEDVLDLLYQQLYPWTKSTQEHERLRSMSLSYDILALYVEKCNALGGSHFSRLGVLLAHNVPRCSDPCVTIRQKAFDCIAILLRTSLKFEGKDPQSSDPFIDTLPSLKDKVQRVDANVMFSAINDLAKVLTKKIPPNQLTSFMDGIYEALVDPQVLSSSGSCVILNGVLKARGGELHSQVDKVLVALYTKLQEIQHSQTKTGTLRAIRTLASHHLLRVVTLLLDEPLPLSQNVVEIWHVIGQDQQLAAMVIDQLLEMIFRSLPYEEIGDGKGKEKPSRRAMQTPLAVTCALTELSKSEECEIPVMNCYPRLLAAMLINTASMVGSRPPRVDKDKKDDDRYKTTFLTGELKLLPSTIAVDGLKQIIAASRSERFHEMLNKENVWALLTDSERFCDGFTLLARCMAETQPEFIPKLINNLNPVLSGLYHPQRAMAAAIFAELISQRCAGDMTLVDMLVNNLLGRLVDGDQLVRMLCIRGLGNIADAGASHVQKYCTMVLSAMMAGMDDKEDTDDIITLEAMSGLSKILAQVSESDIQAILINVALRIRPCFEKERTAVRATAFSLFGNLAAFGNGPSKEPFLEQIHTNMVSLLLHLNDSENEVKQACKQALRQLGPLIGSSRMNTMFQNHLLDGAFLHYGEFMNDLSKTIIEDLPEKLNYYVMGNVTFFKSVWSEIRSNAAIFVGFLLGNMPAEQCTHISKEHVCGALMQLLKDPEPEVRIRAAEAMSLLANI